MTAQYSKAPLAIQQAVREANKTIAKLQREADKRGGRSRKVPNGQSKSDSPALFIADTPEEIDACLQIIEALIGPRVPGNKRRGRISFYTDLITCFIKLRSLGIRPPRGGSLSRRSWDNGLADVLIRHEKVLPNVVLHISKNGRERTKLGRRFKREFDATARAVAENYPT